MVTSPSSRTSRPAWRFLLVVVLALAIPIVPFVVIGELPGERWLSATDDNALLFGVTGSALLTADILIPIPSTVVGTLLAARLGMVPGGLWTWAGLMIGQLFAFAAANYLLGRLDVRVPARPNAILVFLSRPVPVLAEAVSITAGASRMTLRQFAISCGAGNAVFATALAANGATLLPESLTGPGLVLPMTLPVVAWLLWRWFDRQREQTET